MMGEQVLTWQSVVLHRHGTVRSGQGGFLRESDVMEGVKSFFFSAVPSSR